MFGDTWWYRATYEGQTGYVSQMWIDAEDEPIRSGVDPC